jgi:hypothetical protein
MRHHETAEDGPRALNRIEDLRLIPKAPTASGGFMSFGPDAESINRRIEDPSASTALPAGAGAAGW